MEGNSGIELHRRPAWILCNPRCGSGYLCGLLNYTNKFEPLMKKRAFGEWLKLYKSKEEFSAKPAIFNKCTRTQFVALFGEITHREFESLLPDVRYILVQRRDLYAQAVSMYIAKYTNQYHVFSKDSLAKYLDQKVEFQEELILKMYRNALEYPRAWRQFLEGSSYLEIYYEDLKADPQDILSRICHYLGVAINGSDISSSIQKHPFVPTTRPEADEFIQRLKKMAGAASGIA